MNSQSNSGYNNYNNEVNNNSKSVFTRSMRKMYRNVTNIVRVVTRNKRDFLLVSLCVLMLVVTSIKSKSKSKSNIKIEISSVLKEVLSNPELPLAETTRDYDILPRGMEKAFEKLFVKCRKDAQKMTSDESFNFQLKAPTGSKTALNLVGYAIPYARPVIDLSTYMGGKVVDITMFGSKSAIGSAGNLVFGMKSTATGVWDMFFATVNALQKNAHNAWAKAEAKAQEKASKKLAANTKNAAEKLARYQAFVRAMTERSEQTIPSAAEKLAAETERLKAAASKKLAANTKNAAEKLARYQAFVRAMTYRSEQTIPSAEESVKAEKASPVLSLLWMIPAALGAYQSTYGSG